MTPSVPAPAREAPTLAALLHELVELQQGEHIDAAQPDEMGRCTVCLKRAEWLASHGVSVAAAPSVGEPPSAPSTTEERAARLDTLSAHLHDTVSAESAVAHHYEIAHEAITMARGLLSVVEELQQESQRGSAPPGDAGLREKVRHALSGELLRGILLESPQRRIKLTGVPGIATLEGGDWVAVPKSSYDATERALSLLRAALAQGEG